MNYIWNRESLNKALNLDIKNDIEAGIIEFNSKEIKGGELFVAITGGQTDGHLYVKDALSRGASAAIVSSTVEEVDKDKLILVEDTYEALLKLAYYKRNNVKAKFIGVTGSVGKTSTKNAIFTVLAPYAKIFRTRGNFNNHLGIPINLASIPDDTEIAVMEMGMNNTGEIRFLTKMVKPDIAVITNIEAVHIGFLGSMQAIFDAKCEIFEGLSEDGIAIINADSPYVNKMLDKLKAENIQKIFTFSNQGKGNVNVTSIEHLGDSMKASYKIFDEVINLSTNIVGAHQALNNSIALLITKILGYDLARATLALTKLTIDKGRGTTVPLSINNINLIIINDSYNANGASITAGLNSMRYIKSIRKVAVLSEMYELGEYGQREHEALVKPILENDIDFVITIGDLMRFLHVKLPKEKTIHFENLNQLKENILNYLNDGDLVLFKGSKGTKLHLFVEEFIKQKI